VLIIKKIIAEVLYVSKLTGTNNKKVLIVMSVFFSQLAAITDLSLIAVFSYFITGENTQILFVNNLLDYFSENQYLILIIVISRFFFQYSQSMMLKQLEYKVDKNLKIYLLKEIYDKRNYSVADSYFYINVLAGHVSFFYTSIAAFLNSLFQIGIFSFYLFASQPNSIFAFLASGIVLAIPTRILIKKARSYIHISYEKGKESNSEVQRAVENMFLIKILKKENEEINSFTNTLESFNQSMLKNHSYSLFTGYLPSFVTLFLLSSIFAFTTFQSFLTLDFIGVTLKLFQSLGGLSGSANKIINSHVHIEKFHDLDKNKLVNKKENFVLTNENQIEFNNVNFKYFNSEENIFENINFKIKKNTHTLIVGPNGSGKSTLMGLISGIYFSQSGKVNSFSDKFGYIGATPLIFDASLRENLIYGNKNKINDEDLIESLRELDTFKEEKGYVLDRPVSNKTLSSGQMQKIAFIRAFVSDAEILLLDEATANLDAKSKKYIFNILLNKNLTIINSTHDPDSFENIDSILKISLENGNRAIDIIQKK
jgi:ABC-type bacteriocin/lantibiotic exporter with double-glycine peptidase domain